MAELPAGFVLDPDELRPKASSALPQGFVLEEPLPDDLADVAQKSVRGLLFGNDPDPVPNEEAKRPRYLTPGEYTVDLAKSGALGLANFGVHLAGLPADLFNLGQFAASKLLGETDEDRARRPPETFDVGPTSNKIRGWINDLTRPAPTPEQIAASEAPQGPFDYLPRSEAAEVAERMGEYAPAVIAGPGTALRKTLMTATPAVAGVAARNAAEGTPAEPYAELIAAIAAGGITAGRKQSLTKQIAKGAPTAAAVASKTTELYDRLRAAGIKYDANAFGQMAGDLERKLKSFRAKQAPLSADVVDYVKEHVGKSPDFTDFDSIRQSAGQILRETTASDADRAAASIILEVLDDFSVKSPFMTSGKIDPQLVNPLMAEAREMARRNIISVHVKEMIRKAEEHQSGVDSGLRNQFSSYLQSNKGKRLTPEEYEAFQAVSKRVSAANAVRGLSKFGVDFSRLASGATVLPTLATGGAAYALGLLPAASLMGGGTIARLVSPRVHRALANRAQGVVLAGVPAQKVAGQLSDKETRELLIRRIIAGDIAIQASRHAQPSLSPIPQQ